MGCRISVGSDHLKGCRISVASDHLNGLQNFCGIGSLKGAAGYSVALDH